MENWQKFDKMINSHWILWKINDKMKTWIDPEGDEAAVGWLDIRTNVRTDGWTDSPTVGNQAASKQMHFAFLHLRFDPPRSGIHKWKSGCVFDLVFQLWSIKGFWTIDQFLAQWQRRERKRPQAAFSSSHMVSTSAMQLTCYLLLRTKERQKSFCNR